MALLADEEIEKWRKAGKITAQARELAASLVVPGARLEDVAEKTEGFIRSRGGLPAFPLNLSIDHWAAHYTPEPGDPMAFQDGQLVKVDTGAHVDGYIADSAKTVEVGGTRRHGSLIKASKEALAVALEMIGPGVALSKVGEAIEATISTYGFKPISNLTGHLVKRFDLHAGKSVPNVKSKKGDTAVADEVFAIEPFATTGEGVVENGEPGNIYKWVGRKNVKDPGASKLMAAIERDHPHLPFASRWERDACKDIRRSIKVLRQAGVVYAYPVLVERGWGAVSQHEHTVLLTEAGAILLT